MKTLIILAVLAFSSLAQANNCKDIKARRAELRERKQIKEEKLTLISEELNQILETLSNSSNNLTIQDFDLLQMRMEHLRKLSSLHAPSYQATSKMLFDLGLRFEKECQFLFY